MQACCQCEALLCAPSVCSPTRCHTPRVPLPLHRPCLCVCLCAPCACVCVPCVCVCVCPGATCPAENCPGMVGPIGAGLYYCTHEKAGYCDRRSGACFCYDGYSGMDCAKCHHTHYEQGELCLEKSAFGRWVCGCGACGVRACGVRVCRVRVCRVPCRCHAVLDRGLLWVCWC